MNSAEGSYKRGIAFMVGGTMVVPVMDAIAKYLGDSMSPITIAWGRFLFQFILMGGVLLFLPRTGNLLPSRLPIHALRGTLLTVATILFFFSLRYLQLAEAIAIFFVQPIILTIISAYFLGETIGWHRKSAVVVGFLGALLVIRPGTDAFVPASLLPVGAAFFFACYLALTRSVSHNESAVSMQFASGLFATIILSVIMLAINVIFPESSLTSLPRDTQWLWLALIGVVAALGHLAIVVGMKHAPASMLAPFGYVEIIAATILGWYIFDEWPDAITWIGIAVITASGIYVYLREQKLAADNRIPSKSNC